MQNKQLGGLASGVSSNDIYKKSIKGDLDGNKRLAQVEPFRAQAEQMRYLYEQVRGYALGSESLNYAVPTENNAIGTTDAEISNTKEGFTDLLNTVIAHNNLLKVNTNSSTSSAWVLEREAYMNDAPDAPDGENYSRGNIAFAIFGYDKTFTVISPYDVTEAALTITLPAMDNVSGQIAVKKPDGTGFVSLQQNKRYYFRTYFDGTTPKIVLENSELVASETAYFIGDLKQSAQMANHGKWLLCNGQAVSRSTYSKLFSLIGTSSGAGDGSTTFTLPDYRGRVHGSIGQGSGLTNRTLGEVVGEESHALTIPETPSHDHIQRGNNIGQGNNTSGGSTSWAGAGTTALMSTTSSTGGGAAHNNMQPTLFGGNTFIYAGI